MYTYLQMIIIIILQQFLLDTLGGVSNFICIHSHDHLSITGD